MKKLCLITPLFAVHMSMVVAKAFAYDFESGGIYLFVNGESGFSK